MSKKSLDDKIAIALAKRFMHERFDAVKQLIVDECEQLIGEDQPLISHNTNMVGNINRNELRAEQRQRLQERMK